MTRRIFTVLLLVLSPIAYASGPVGVGDLRLGLTLDQVQALPHGGAIDIVKALTPGNDENIPLVAGQYRTEARTPWSNRPISVDLRFSGGVLVRIALYFNDVTESEVLKEITAKYGNPVTDNNAMRRRCSYSNGTAFDIHYGTVTHSWVQQGDDGKNVYTSVETLVRDFCPPNPRLHVQPFELHYLIIAYGNVGSSNPF